LNDSEDLIDIHVVDALPCQHKAEVTVKAAMVDKTLSRLTAEYRRQAQIPGFRPGKAPLPLVHKRFAPQIAERAREMLMQDACRKAMNDCEGTPASMPSLVDDLPEVEAKKDFHFAIAFDLDPSFELPEVDGIPIECPDVEVRDEDVAETIDSMRGQQATYEEAERPIQDKDIVKVTLKATKEIDPAEDAGDALPTAEEYVQIGTREGYEGIGEVLLGKSPGDTVTADLVCPPHGSPDFVGRTFTYEITVDSITETCLPELTDEWVSEHFEGKNVEELQEEVRAELAKRIERNQRNACERGVCEYLLENCVFDVPPTQLHEETTDILSSIHKRHHHHHEHGEDCEFEKNIEKYKEDAKEQAARNLRLRYIFQRVAAEKELQPDEEEFRNNAMMAMMQAEQHGTEYDPQTLMHNVQQNMLIGAAVDYLIEKASVTYVELPEESEEED
jgi:trigger factor